MRPDRLPTWTADFFTGLAVYAVTAVPVGVGLAAATTPGFLAHDGPPPDLLTACAQYDGTYFRDIVRHGYQLDPDRQSTVAFFPGYPLAAGCVAAVTGLGPEAALLLTANAAFILALGLLAAYLRVRFPDQPAAFRRAALLALGFWPAGVVFRMAYSESLFLALLALLLLGLARRWPAVILAAVAGAATGVRAAGVAAAAAVLAHVLFDPARGSVRRRLGVAAALAPLTCWGLLGYMTFQAVRFGDPLAFARAQDQWRVFFPDPPGPLPKLARLAAAEPLWDVYVPGSPRHWRMFDPHRSALLGTAFWNPALFLGAAVAVAFAWRRGWANGPEAVLGFGLLAVPYLTRADEMSMASHARFAAVVVPVYVVLGRLVAARPAVGWAGFGVLGAVLAVWTAGYCAGRPMF
ncbi:MAG: hypothetical protein K2X87_12990 [Gemmataceae bacterium]|nr:hypothetical protein [Gemmataceae bacterium]